MNHALNQVMKGDCLTELAKLDGASADLIYLDPPFFTNKRVVSSVKSNDFNDF